MIKVGQVYQDKFGVFKIERIENERYYYIYKNSIEEDWDDELKGTVTINHFKNEKNKCKLIKDVKCKKKEKIIVPVSRLSKIE